MAIAWGFVGLFVSVAEADEPARFTIDSVLVTPIGGPVPPGVDVAAFDGILRDTFGARFVTIGLADATPVDGVSAKTYLASCPAGGLDGCVYVLASRSEVDWGVGAVFTSGGFLEVSFLDVAGDEVAFRLTLPVDAADPGSIASAVASTLAWVLEGGARQEDVREVVPDRAEQWASDKEDAAAKAAELVGLDAELGAMLEVGGRASPKPLTVGDLSRFLDEDDAVAPWDRLGMDEATWVRFQNSGLSEPEFRLRSVGRDGRLVVRVLALAGATPFGQRYEGWVVHDATTLEAVGAAWLRERALLLGPGGVLELAWGPAPNLELGLRAQASGSFQRTELFREYLGDVAALGLGQEQEGASTAELGARVAWVGTPGARARPTVGASFGRWFGSAVGASRELLDELPDPGGLGAWVIRPDVGVEVELLSRLDVVLRVGAPVALGGARAGAEGTASGLGGPTASGAPPLGVEAGVGVQARLGSVPEGVDTGPE